MILSQDGPSRRARSLTLAMRISPVAALSALVAAALIAFSGTAQGASEACTTNTQQGTLCVSITDTPTVVNGVPVGDPVAYSSFDGNVTYVDYGIVVSNQSTHSSLSHVGLIDTLPDGTSFVSATSSVGSCSAAGQTVTCPIGSMKKGQSATIEIVVTAPATAATNPPDITITNTATAAFDERFNDQTGGKQDTATATETTTVSKTAGTTFVPAGHSGKVDTDPAGEQYANTLVPDASTDVLATIRLLPPDNFCVDGTVRIGNKTYVCRDGGFVDVTVVNADTGGHYSNTQHPLVFHLRWAASLVSGKQTVKNFVVFYQASDGAPTQVFDTRCNATASNTPCLRNIAEDPTDGSWSVDLVKPDNGHMR
jgi:uncharacterized repeat protein (TIGR01451 family)